MSATEVEVVRTFLKTQPRYTIPDFKLIKEFLKRSADYNVHTNTEFYTTIALMRRVTNTIVPGNPRLHELFVVTFIIAFKYHNDVSYTTQAYNTLSGISVERLLHLERNVLQCLGYSAFISETEFFATMEEFHMAQ